MTRLARGGSKASAISVSTAIRSASDSPAAADAGRGALVTTESDARIRPVALTKLELASGSLAVRSAVIASDARRAVKGASAPSQGQYEARIGSPSSSISPPGAAAAAPGHRKTIVDGIMAESIGAASTVTTPGSIKWTSLGAGNFAVGGGHSTRAVRISRLTGGISSDTAASVSIKTAQGIGRNIKGALKTSIAGSLDSKAGGAHLIKAGGALTLKVGGSMDVEGGAVVFAVGGSTVVAVHSGGVLFKATKITINGKAVQSGKATNSE